MSMLANWKVIAESGGLFAGSIILGLVAHALLFWLGGRVARRTETMLDGALLEHCRKPARVLLPLLVVEITLPMQPLPPGVLELLRHALSIGLILAMAWLAARLTRVMDDVVLARLKREEADNLRARKLSTQLRVLRRFLVVVIVIIAGSAVLMTFDKVRQLGTSILASAGVVGLVAGIAAQRTLANLFAGLQIAITQPIRIDDVVVVEGEWGRIEEITLTYVVVQIWDKRRLVVPISTFIEKPFQNWTRVTADLLGTVFLYVDYSVPVLEVRDELRHILEGSELWDGQVCGLQVTNATEHTLELRALMSASDSSKAWDLRCAVREKLVEFVQRTYPGALPRVRAEVLGSATEPPAREPSGPSLERRQEEP
jgi:small-conductance mechanosensitive channel